MIVFLTNRQHNKDTLTEGKWSFVSLAFPLLVINLFSSMEKDGFVVLFYHKTSSSQDG